MNEIIQVIFKDELISGILVNEDEKIVVIKLSSGYNANLKKSEIKILKREKRDVEKEKGRNELSNKEKNLPKISILHTGGTIASKVDYRTGAVSSKFKAEELLNLFPELNDKAQIKARMIDNIFSEDMRFRNYNIILKAIEEEINEGCEGIIIGHGTDTMHYSAVALQYAMKNIKVPVILVGSQRSSDRASSDAFSNLDAALSFLLNQINNDRKFLRVGICMHENMSDDSFLILDSINSKKMHSTRRDAFKQINYLPFARILNGKIEILREELLSLKEKEAFYYEKYDEKLKIGFFKSHPNLFAWELDRLIDYDAIIIEGTGIGNIAESESNESRDSKILDALKNLCSKIRVFSSVQTVYGEVSLDIYSRGRDIQGTGIIGNRHNLISETVFIRVAYCLSQRDRNFNELWESNLEGFKIRSEDNFY
jgi:glutamyl-tRNA(Gln) amidotransferase subunit D